MNTVESMLKCIHFVRRTFEWLMADLWKIFTLYWRSERFQSMDHYVLFYFHQWSTTFVLFFNEVFRTVSSSNYDKKPVSIGRTSFSFISQIKIILILSIRKKKFSPLQHCIEEEKSSIDRCLMKQVFVIIFEFHRGCLSCQSAIPLVLFRIILYGSKI